MSTVPQKASEAIAWVKARVPVWTAAAADIGVDANQITALGVLQSTAEALAAEVVAMQAATDAKAEEAREGARAMRTAASGQVVRIRGFARTAPNPGAVYTAAQIPAPADRAPAPPPGLPESFRVSLLESGGLGFTFKCDHPKGVAGVTYKIERQDAPQTPFVFLQNAKERSFEDDSFPSTSNLIYYRVTAQTSTKDGPSGGLTVRYGAGNQSGGQATIVSQGPAVDTKAS